MSKYYYWLIIFDPDHGYCGSNICVSSPAAIHDFVLSHLNYLPRYPGDYLYYGYERTSILPNDFIHMPFRDETCDRDRFFYQLNLNTLTRERLH